MTNLRTHQAILVGLALMLFSVFTWAQNVKRIEEEAVLDEQRRKRVQELIKEREREEEKIRNTNLTDDELRARNLVEVEPNNVLPSDLSSAGALVPYSARRPRWGLDTGVVYSTFHPDSYVSDFAALQLINFDSLYGEDPLIEFYLNYKFNFSLGSVGAEIAYGTYSNDVDDTSFGAATLDITQYRLGLKYIMDNLFYEPTIAPYGGLGAYVVNFSEELSGNSFNGTTDPAVYYYFGALFQLNWLDPRAAMEAYTEGGIENTFVFLEARQYLASSQEQDPDFSTDFNFSGGFSLEF